MRLRAVAKRMQREESGVVLVLAVVCMVFILGFAAIAIDVGSWYQTQRQAQAAADAGALAAAVVASSQANTTATTWVGKNVSGATTTVSFPASNQVKVTVTTTASIFFGRIFGMGPPAVSASAIAQKSAGQQSCSSPGNTCYAVFAMDSSCTGTPITFGGGTLITGAVWSNGSLNVGGGGSSFGATSYGNGVGCSVSPSGYQQQSNTFTAGPTARAKQTSWPLDYTLDFPACGAGSCSGPLGTPSWCTQASTASSWQLMTYNPSNLTSGNIYCGVGSGTPSTPTTWNGAITASGGPVTASFVAGSVVLSGGDTITACGYATSGYTASTCSASVPRPVTTNYPIVYAVGTGTSIDNSSGGGKFTGDMFAPNGTIYIGGGVSTFFLEGWDIYAPGGGFTGDGPTYSGDGGGGGSSSTGASLVG
ncbi:MAG: pilus assembly protein TadG-related protein [Solirubrobacteraceae bacterium]